MARRLKQFGVLATLAACLPTLPFAGFLPYTGGSSPRRQQLARVARLLLVLSTAAPFISAIGLTTTEYNGSLFYHAWNNGTISNQTWLNTSSNNAQLATTEGQGIEEAVLRMQYYDFKVGLFYMVGNHPQNYTTAELTDFQTYGFSDNSTYWRTESNRSFQFGQRHLTIRFKHEQQTWDDLINVILEANASGNINLPNEAWFGIGLTGISGFDTVNYGNETSSIQSQPVGGNASFENWTFVSIGRFDDGWSWKFENSSEEQRLIVIDGNDVWMLYYVGNSITGNKRYSVGAIDAENCVITCGPGDAVTLSYGVIGDDNQQVPDNLSIWMRWTDALNSCSVGPSGCAMQALATNPYSTFLPATYTTIQTYGTTNPGAGWIYCNEANSSHGCEGTTVKNAQKTNPVRATNYSRELQDGGRYNRSSFIHSVIVRFSGLGGGTPTIITGFDTISPNVTSCYPFNGTDGQTFTNNSQVNFYATNGSLSWVNATFACDFDNTTRCGSVGCDYFSATGLVNNSFVQINLSGYGINMSAQPDAPSATQKLFVPSLQNGAMLQICGGANGTNRQATGQDLNWTWGKNCWWLKVNILALPTPGVSMTTQVITAKLFWRKQSEENDAVVAAGFDWPLYLISSLILLSIIGAFNQT